MSLKILFIVDNVCKGFFYRFMYVCVREKMAGKVNRYLLMDYQTGIS